MEYAALPRQELTMVREQGALLEWLVQIESAREPVTDRAALPPLLAQIAAALGALCGAPVQLATDPACFTPPLALTVGPPLAPGSVTTLPLRWGSMQLGWALTDGAPELLAQQPVLLRIAAETLAELSVAEAQQRAARDAARAAARQALAAALHDSTKQTLAAIRLFAGHADRNVLADPPVAQQYIRTIDAAAQDALDELLFVIGALRGRPAQPDLAALLHELRAQVRTCAPQLTLDWRIALPPLDERRAACVLALLRNALANVLVHAQARHVTVVVDGDASTLHIAVHDDGIGTVVDRAVAEPGIGLDLIRERMEVLGGRLVLRSALAAGLMLDAWLPLIPEEIV